MRKRCSIQQGEKNNSWLEQSPENWLFRFFGATRYSQVNNISLEVFHDVVFSNHLLQKQDKNQPYFHKNMLFFSLPVFGFSPAGKNTWIFMQFQVNRGRFLFSLSNLFCVGFVLYLNYFVTWVSVWIPSLGL